MVNRGDTVTGYQRFSETYDTTANGLFQYDEPIVREILDAQPKGIALHAACGHSDRPELDARIVRVRTTLTIATSASRFTW